VRGIPRGHGHWRSHFLPRFPPGRPTSEEALNKDWSGRPKYQEAYLTAYFATRQWVRAMRTWLGNEPLWNRAMSMPQTSALAHDITGAEEISQYSGHWQGGGEPCVRFINCSVRSGKAGSLSSLTVALRDFHAGPTSRYRRAFNQMIGEWALFGDIPDLPDPPSSRTIQALTRFAKLEVLAYRGISLGDPVGDAEIYANVRLRGQPSTSTIIDSADSFSFPRPYAPFTWIRSVPTPNQASTPVTSMTVRVETGNRSGAGTDDDIYLRINGTQRFSLDKALYDDFERGDDDTYSVPIGDATRDGLSVGDIDRVAIEKSSDGRNGSWFLHGVTLIVNGQVIVRNRAIDRSLQGSSRTWVAPGFVRDHRTADVVGVWLQLREDDFGPNDTGDINGFDRHTSLPIAYRMGTTVSERARGGAQLAGRLPLQNGDRAQATYRLSTLTVTPAWVSPRCGPSTCPATTRARRAPTRSTRSPRTTRSTTSRATPAQTSADPNGGKYERDDPTFARWPRSSPRTTRPPCPPRPPRSSSIASPHTATTASRASARPTSAGHACTRAMSTARCWPPSGAPTGSRRTRSRSLLARARWRTRSARTAAATQRPRGRRWRRPPSSRSPTRTSTSPAPRS
jgi:hypothetical protein